MAQGRKSPYGKYGVYGSLAYDFLPVGNEGAGEYGRVEKPVSKAKRKKCPRRSPALQVSAILCAVLLFAGLMAQSELVALSGETVALQEEIESLLEEQTRLKIRHEMAFSMADTERYAIEVLGMQKPSAEQILYIDISESVDVASTEPDGRTVRDILSLLREYFPG